MGQWFDSLKRLSDIPVKKKVARPLWMPVGILDKNGWKVELRIPPNPYIVYKSGQRKLFYAQAHQSYHSLIGNAGAKLDLRFGTKVLTQVVQRTKDAPSYGGMADLGSSVNYHPELYDNFKLQQLIGVLWDSGFALQNYNQLPGRVVKFVIPECPQSILDVVYKRHFDVALALGLTDERMFNYPYFVEVKSKSTLYSRKLTVINEIRAGEVETTHFEGIVNVDNSNSVNYLALLEAHFSDKESDFKNLRAFDCEVDYVDGIQQYLFRDIYMDEEMIFHPDTGEISAPEWMFVKGHPIRNPSTRPIICTPVLQECLRAELEMPPIY